MGGQLGVGSWSRNVVGWTVVLAVGWTAAIGGLLCWDHRRIGEQAVRLAAVDARASYDRDIAFRRWAARHGGVYVPETESTPPNPFLSHVPERDLETPSGRRLTLMNSAYISRQIYDWFANPGGTRGHVTSLRPLRPANAPDPWEAEALRAFERGDAEILARQQVDGEDFLRLMRPVATESECLKCHAVQGYRVGEIRGGISISVPMKNYTAEAGHSRRFALAAYATLWLLGIGGISTAGLVVGRRAKAQQACGLALLESERKFRAIFNQSFHLAGVLAPDGTIIDINGCALEFAGVRLPEVIGKPFWDSPWWTHDAQARQQVRAAVEQVAVEGRAVRFATAHRDRSGALREIDFSLRPVKDERGRTVLLVPEGVDVTERNRAERERVALTQRLLQAEKLESIGRLAGGVAHDFNNLLAPVMGYADMLLVGKPADHPDRAAAEAIIDAVNRARGLTEQLLACAHNRSIKSKPVDLNETIRGFERVLRRSLGEAVALEQHLDPSIPSVQADPRQLEQVLLNLAVNARQAITGDGRLEIRTATAPSNGLRAASCGGHGDQTFVLLTVRDNGAGMSPEMLERVFEPFYTTKSAGEGTGLGLAIVYGIVKQHGGHIQLESDLGRGTTFKIYLPRAVESSKPDDVGQLERSHRGDETILVVEDDDAVRRMICGVLTSQGYRVLEAATGRGAVKTAEQADHIDLLVSDLNLPDMEGQALRQRLAECGKAVPALYMSGYDAAVMAEASAGATGRIDFVQKPFAWDDFSGKLEALLARG